MVDNDTHCKWVVHYVMKYSAGTSLQCYVDQTLSRFREGVATPDYRMHEYSIGGFQRRLNRVKWSPLNNLVNDHFHMIVCTHTYVHTVWRLVFSKLRSGHSGEPMLIYYN